MRCCLFSLKVTALYIFIHLVCVAPASSSVVFEADTAPGDTTSQKYAFIHFQIEPDTVYLYLNSDYQHVITVTNEMKLKMPTGQNNLEIFGPEISDNKISVFLAEGQTQVVRLGKRSSAGDKLVNPMYAAYRWNANLMLFSDDDTGISIPGTEYHANGFIKANLPVGSHKVQFRSATGRVTERLVEVNSHELRTDETYFRPRKDIALMAGIIPGGSQLYKRQPVKAVSVFSAFAVSTGLAIYYNQQIGVDARQFNTMLALYDRAGNIYVCRLTAGSFVKI